MIDLKKVDSAFQAACIAVKTLSRKPTDDELLVLYGLYKQATEHNCNIPEPAFFEFKNSKKWKAWKSHEGKDSVTMKLIYVQKVQELMKKYN